MGSFMADDPGIGRVVFTAEQIASRIAELGAQLTSDYQGRDPLLVCVLKGAYVFATDLARCVDLPVQLDFIVVASYGSSTQTSGVVRMVKDLDIDIDGRDVVIVEDIVDSGLTLRYLRRNLEARGPASLEVCALLARERADLDALGVNYVGFRVPADYLIGYGLDVAQRYRNLPYLALYDAEGDVAVER